MPKGGMPGGIPGNGGIPGGMGGREGVGMDDMSTLACFAGGGASSSSSANPT